MSGTTVDGEVLNILPVHDALCLELDTVPEHTYEKFDSVQEATERELKAIGAAARIDEAAAVKRAPLELKAAEVIEHANVKSAHPRSPKGTRRKG